MQCSYRGWELYDNGPSHHPVTGRFQALCHGVRVSANTLELLKTIIDNRISDYPPEGV